MPLDSVDLHANISFDVEPSEQAKAYIRAEVMAALKDIIGDGKWLREVVAVEIRRTHGIAYAGDVPRWKV